MLDLLRLRFRHFTDSWKKEGRKYFFFEKKKQKTFTCFVQPTVSQESLDLTQQIKVFGSFFQKRTASFASIITTIDPGIYGAKCWCKQKSKAPSRDDALFYRAPTEGS
jgi:hypothetical protein